LPRVTRFGQNRGWPTGRVGGWQAFARLRVRTKLVALSILPAVFERRGRS
jgi:hypothetical protein